MSHILKYTCLAYGFEFTVLNIVIRVTKQRFLCLHCRNLNSHSGVWIKVRVCGRAPRRGVGGKQASDPLQLGVSSLALLPVSEWAQVWFSNK